MDTQPANERGAAWARENRTDLRVAADLRVDLSSVGFAGPLLASTRDLSIGGACIATACPIAHRSIRSIALHLPERRLLRVDVAGRWQQLQPSSGSILTGIQFADLAPDAQDALWDFVFDTGKLLARFLRRHSALGGVGVEGALGIAHASRLRIVRAGDLIYGPRETTAGSVFLVQDGEVSLQMRVRGVRNHTFAHLRSGEIFGGHSVIAHAESAEIAVATTPARLLEIDERAFVHMSGSRPRLAQQIAFAASEAHVRRMREAIDALASERPDAVSESWRRAATPGVRAT